MPLTVLSTLAVKTAFTRDLLPVFSQRNGITPDIRWSPTTVLMQNIAAGVRADVVISIDAPMADLAVQGIVQPDTVRAIATAVIGIAVAPGATIPNISTVENLKQALVSARSVALSRAGASGIYFSQLLAQLGIADVVNAKATFIPEGFTAEKIIDGSADMAVQQISELMTVDGVQIAGPLPEDVQLTTDFSVGIFKGAENLSAAKQFVAFLSSSDAHAAYERGGLTSRLAL